MRKLMPWLILTGLLLVWVYADALLPQEKLAAATVTVVDGDTFAMPDRTIRLFGIDAPEYHQDCTDAKGQSWPCGKSARIRLASMVASGNVVCVPLATDHYKRTVARCSSAGEPDLGRVMVHAGLAISPAERGTAAYADDQEAARLARRGIWQGAFQNPSAWRAAHPRAVPPQP
jgi:endonuclease YncB( thermonuclease family)